jgi:integrase
MFKSRSRKLPYFFSKENIFKMVDNIDDPKLMTAFTIALFCGLRIGEICKLKFSDIDFSNRTITVRDGKMPYKIIRGYGKDRVVPIPEKVMPILKMWQCV